MVFLTPVLRPSNMNFRFQPFHLSFLFSFLFSYNLGFSSLYGLGCSVWAITAIRLKQTLLAVKGVGANNMNTAEQSHLP
jgi:hypothetical protein